MQNEELRNNIKDALMSNLANENRQQVKSCSLSVATIAAIEVPDGKWDDFINLMEQQAMQEDNFNNRISAL